MEKNINIKRLLKRVGSLLTAYVLVLGSFSAIVPFLFVQKVGALSDHDSKYSLVVDSDYTSGSDQSPENPILFKVKVVDNNEPETAVSIAKGYKAKLSANNEYNGIKKGNIVKLESSAVDCSGVVMTSAEEGESVHVDLGSGEKAEASFCYLATTDCVATVEFSAVLEPGSLGDNVPREFSKNMLIKVKNLNTEINTNMSFDVSTSGQITFLWDEIKNNGQSATGYKIMLTKYLESYGQPLVYISNDIEADPVNGKYEHLYEYEYEYETDESDYSWCVVANFSDGSDNKLCSPLQRFVVPRRKITIKIEDAQKTYGEDDPVFGSIITFGKLLEGDVLKPFSAERKSGEDVGRYRVDGSNIELSNPNYEITFEPGYLEIIPKAVKIIVGNYTKIDGEYDPVFEYKIVDEDGETVKDDTIIVQLARTEGEGVGKYDLKASVGENKNYKFDTSHSGVLEIVEKPVELAVASVAIARAIPTTYYDRVGVATDDGPEKEEVKKVEEKKESDKKEEEKKETWKIFGFAWYWWGLAILSVGALRWWFGGASLVGEGKDTTKSSDK